MGRLPELLQEQHQQYQQTGALQRLNAQDMLTELKQTYVMADQHVIHEGGKVESKSTTAIDFF